MTSKRKESKRPEDFQTRATLNSTHAHNKSIDLRSERKTATERNTCGGRGSIKNGDKNYIPKP